MSTSSSSSSFNSFQSLPPLATLTPAELTHILENETFHSVLDTAFPPGYSSTTNLRHFAFISHTIAKMERELTRFKREKEFLFDELWNSNRFKQCMSPIVQQSRQLRRENAQRQASPHHHPYSRPTSPNTSSSPSARSVVITADSVNALLIPYPPVSPTTTNSSSSYHSAVEPLGTRSNPIVIEEDDEEVCARCNQRGHLMEDCDTPLRSFAICPTCVWSKREICDHYDASPAWIKRQQEAIAQRT
jgi:hypothetical protein